ncbi:MULTISPECIES: energy-coupling factor transporter transmembrane component T family protein [Sediminimonas]|uniref:energy-coupling factor transporter transmembrane component T family protein n=1 Tax=Sediminimonas TaxID=659427 RepID=UPI0004284246|nr:MULTISPECIES: energy-coupling factor transporter transmembrane component T [Sediminimonas]MDR9486153.1 energy-coupling factor transporter transmembrane component T [Sediminimonas sp.]
MLTLTSDIRTPYHGLRAGVKLAALCGATVGLFWLPNPVAMAGGLAAVAGLYLVPGWQFLREGVRLLKPIWFFVVLVLLWHVFMQQAMTGAVIALRLVAAVALANLVTMTTRFDDLIDVVMWLLTPLRRAGLNTAPLGFAIVLVVRFIPVLMDKANKLIDAWRARSARRVGWQVALPITLCAIDDAEHVAEALRARGGLNAPQDP